MADTSCVRVRVRTALGTLVFRIDADAAPRTAETFLRYVDGGFLDGSAVYRIVTRTNQQPTPDCPIEVVQWGWVPSAAGTAAPLPAAPHEPTGATGLAHRHGTLSAARTAPGTAGHAYFVCVGDQPELDEGGRRHPDGLGFAAFGVLEHGEDVLRALFARAEATEYLATPIPVDLVSRVRGACPRQESR